MGTRTRPMAIDGHSLAADLSIDPDTLQAVQIVIIDILRRYGPLVDDSIIQSYDWRSFELEGVPHVTPQRVRTARAELVRKGLVRASTEKGTSAIGNPATVWALSIPATK